jgi:hypothetical protein
MSGERQIRKLTDKEIDAVSGGNAHEPPFGGPQGGGPGNSGPGDKNSQGGGLGPPPK